MSTAGPDLLVAQGMWQPASGAEAPAGDLHMQLILSSVSPEVTAGQPTGWLLAQGWRNARAADGEDRDLVAVRLRADALPEPVRQQARQLRGCTCPQEWW